MPSGDEGGGGGGEKTWSTGLSGIRFGVDTLAPEKRERELDDRD